MSAAMAREDADRIRALMDEGLEHYGEGRVERAAACWREVLALDPNHAAARDYLESAELDAGEIGLEERAGGSDAELLEEAMGLVRSDRPADALELLETLSAGRPDRLEAQAYRELLRAHLVGRYRARLGEGAATLRVRMEPERVLQYNLPADAGFLLSLVDGGTRVDELVALAGMDPFAALRTLHQLLETGILEAAPS